MLHELFQDGAFKMAGLFFNNGEIVNVHCESWDIGWPVLRFSEDVSTSMQELFFVSTFFVHHHVDANTCIVVHVAIDATSRTTDCTLTTA